MTSEKILYGKEVAEAVIRLDAEFAFWGEDLLDKRIIVYPKKISKLCGYDEIKCHLVNAVIVYFDFPKENYIKMSVVRFDKQNNMLYISEENFNGIWRYLRNSVKLGIKIHEKEDEFSNMHAEDIVDLTHLQRKGSEVVLKNGKLSYIAKDLSQEEKALLSRKQSLLDHTKNVYFYDIEDSIYHDKDCDRIKMIAPANFMASETFPEGRTPCKKCRRRIALRKACNPYVKQIPLVDRMLVKAGITDSALEKFVYEDDLRFQTGDARELIVKGKEDTWIIKGFDTMQLSLWHNNYVKTAPRERYITQGFHNQGLNGKKLYLMLKYISDYTFEKHLAAEERAELEKQAEEIREEVEGRKREGLLKRIYKFWRSLLR